MTAKTFFLSVTVAASYLCASAGIAEIVSSDTVITEETPSDTATVETTPSEWKLPEGTDIVRNSLRVSPDLGHILFLERGAATIRGPQVLRQLFPSAYWILNAKNSQLTNVLDTLGIDEGKGKLYCRPCGLSANGKYALVLAVRVEPAQIRNQKKKGYRAFVITLNSGAAHEIGENVAAAAWVGNEVVLSSFTGEGWDRKIGKIKVVDPEDESTSELNISGIIVCGHPDGRMLVCGCDKDDPAKATPIRNLGNAEMIVITKEGKILRRLGVVPPVGARPDQLILSANGKYVAFREGRIERGRQPRNVKVRVMMTSGEQEWLLNETATPIGMTDDGRVITVGNVFEDEGAPVKIRDKNFNSRTVVGHAGAATVVGDQLFYLTPGEPPLIKSIKLEL